MEEKKRKKLDKVKKRLYSKNFKEDRDDSNQFEKKEWKLRDEWRNISKEEEMKKSKKYSMMKKIVIASVLFFVAAFSFATFRFSNGDNVVSIDDIEMVLISPVAISGGEQFDFEVEISNTSNIIVESANLFVEYPKGAYLSFDSQKELIRDKIELGSISPSENIQKTFPLVFFGEENTEKEINVTLELRFQDSSATLEKVEISTIKIASSPVNLSLSVPKETNLNQEFEVIVELTSNSNQTISELVSMVEYPFGFIFSSATPPPTSNDNIWDIGDIPPSGDRIIKIRGIMEGQKGDEKEFSVSVGSKDKKDKNSIGTIYNSVSELTNIAEPFIGVNVLVNGSDSHEHVSVAEDLVRVDVLWESNIDTRIIDGKIEVKLLGGILDKFSVSVGSGGFYRSVDNTIVWDKIRSKNLSIIEPNEKGSVSFSLRSLPLMDDASNIFSNPQIVVKATASGKRISDLNVPEEVVSFIAKKIKIESGLALSSRIVYYSGPFKNIGPMPPRAENETTYTVIWTITNTSNKISAAAVSMVLPPYVRWLGVISGNDEMVSFNEAGGEVVWNVGSVSKGAGVKTSSRELAFQVGFLPSVSQVGDSPLITGPASISGEDSFTDTIIKSKAKALSTRLFTDPKFSEIDSQVVF